MEWENNLDKYFTTQEVEDSKGAEEFKYYSISGTDLLLMRDLADEVLQVIPFSSMHNSYEDYLTDVEKIFLVMKDAVNGNKNFVGIMGTYSKVMNTFKEIREKHGIRVKPLD